MADDFCLSCGKRATCKAICPELEAHLQSEVEVPQREVVFAKLKKGARMRIGDELYASPNALLYENERWVPEAD